MHRSSALRAHLHPHARGIAAAALVLFASLAASVAVGAVGLDTAAGVFLGAIVGALVAAAVAARGLGDDDRVPGRRAEARLRAEDAAALEELEPLAPERG